MTAGMAANRPMAVANNASAMPGATTASEVLLARTMAVAAHDAPDGAEQADEGRDRTDRCEDIETVAQAIDSVARRRSFGWRGVRGFRRDRPAWS